MRKRRVLPTQERLHELYTYDPATGVVTRKVDIGRFKAGTRCGTTNRKGGVAMNVDGVVYMLHRIAWVYMTGNDPGKMLDHVNGDALDNRWRNIRQCNPSQNNSNKSIQRNNKLGQKGIFKYGSAGKFRAVISFQGRRKHIGVYSTIAEAKAAYDATAKIIHGDFARS